ncbi:FGFR1OP [Bugula neritina]|uniref:FGFR1OP n=1 Tax=Bugula neritina TaxID=10212 RepID=A0A7J7JC20_BUGNE|nr:FGFR1OP [Bugula neritina]
MSLEEDTELRDIVLETLDQRGVVGKAKAMLRANIFTALEETVAPQDKMYLLNKKLKESLATDEGQLMAGLIVDYLTCLELEFSKTVFEPETGFDCQSISRPSLCKSLGISLPSDKQLPLLAQVIKNSHAGTGDQSLSPRRPQNDLTSKQIADAKTKFSKYDQDGNGTIEKDELRQLFVDMFPNFNRNMLDRYVTDEFRAADTDFSAGIDFDEFLDLYRRLFITCRSVVSHDLSDIIGPISTPRSPSPRSSKIPVKVCSLL